MKPDVRGAARTKATHDHSAHSVKQHYRDG